MYAQREDVGAVGAKLYYPDRRIQHAGIIMGLYGTCGHPHYRMKHDSAGYMWHLCFAQDVSAVMGACLMISKNKFSEVNGLDEGFAVAFKDVDFCMSMRKAGYLNVRTPFAELFHHESISREKDDTDEKQARFAKEVERLQSRWAKELAAGDPYYNPNLTLNSTDFLIRGDNMNNWLSIYNKSKELVLF